MEDGKSIWLIPYLRLQGQLDNSLARALLSSANSAEVAIKRLAGKGGIGAAVRAAQLTQAQTALHRIIQELFLDVNRLTASAQHGATVQALANGFDWDRILLDAVFSNPAERAVMRRNLLAQAPRNIEALIIKMRGGGYPLSQQVYRTQALARGWVDTAIKNALGRGASWKEMADDVSKFIRPDVPGGVSYAAKRLARTEINAAYHAIAVQDAANKPWVKAMSWHLSTSHPQPDICNDYAARTYAPGAVPAKPHPQCFCYVVPELLASSQFVREYQSGVYDVYLRQRYGLAA